jgi:hypothetical protein
MIASSDRLNPNPSRLKDDPQRTSNSGDVSIEAHRMSRGIQDTAVQVPPKMPPRKPSMDLAGEILRIHSGTGRGGNPNLLLILPTSNAPVSQFHTTSNTEIVLAKSRGASPIQTRNGNVTTIIPKIQCLRSNHTKIPAIQHSNNCRSGSFLAVTVAKSTDSVQYSNLDTVVGRAAKVAPLVDPDVGKEAGSNMVNSQRLKP